MNCSLGESLAESGFKFFENLHAPIFLLSKLGKVVKTNKAARKLMGVTHTSANKIEGLIRESFFQDLRNKTVDRVKLSLGTSHLQVIVSNLRNSDYVLVEVKR